MDTYKLTPKHTDSVWKKQQADFRHIYIKQSIFIKHNNEHERKNNSIKVMDYRLPDAVAA